MCEHEFVLVVGKVGWVMILFSVKLSVSIRFRLLLGMFERNRCRTKALSGGTKRCSVGLHRTLIPRVDVQWMFSSISFHVVPWLGGFWRLGHRWRKVDHIFTTDIAGVPLVDQRVSCFKMISLIFYG